MSFIVKRIAYHWGLPELQKLTKGVDYFQISANNLSVIRFLIRKMLSAVEEPETLESSALLDYEDELFGKILSILSNSQPGQKASYLSRKKAIRKINAFLAEHPKELLRVSSLCTISGVSERTLQYAFLEQYGVSPKKYLNNYRLNCVRRELWKSDPDLTKVNDVAGNWEFWHMGQFASDYRKLFGELPSDTLKKRNNLLRQTFGGMV